MIKEIEKSKVQEIESLADKIDKGTASLQDYQRYEGLLLEVGFTEDDVRAKMRQNGFRSYEEYLKAREKASTYEQKRITDAIIVASLVALSMAILLWIAQGFLKQKD